MTRRILGLAFVMGFASIAGAQTLVPNTSTWKWLHSSDGTDPAKAVEDFHTTFFKMDFDDSKWKTGKDKPGTEGGFGYGEPECGTDIGRPVRLSDRKTAYLRLKFKTDEDYENLVLKCQRDDAIIVYIDGKEALRDNVPDGKDAHDMFATKTIASEAETKVNSFPLKIKLPAGEHMLAISLHNREGGSSDLRIAEISLSVASGNDSPSGESE